MLWRVLPFFAYLRNLAKILVCPNHSCTIQWLHYLTLKLLHSKRLKAPVTPRKGHVAASPSSSVAFAERDCYECLVDIEDWLGKCVAGVALPAKGKGKRKPQVSAQVKTTTLLGPLCAGEVVGYGVKKGWIKSP
jgi:serine/threonine-protein kinase haspin